MDQVLCELTDFRIVVNAAALDSVFNTKSLIHPTSVPVDEFPDIRTRLPAVAMFHFGHVVVT